MALSDLQAAIEKHGKSGRYVFLLEQELRNRKTRRKTMFASLAVNAVLVAVICFMVLA